MTPVELVRHYYENVWMAHKVELIPELCADPVLRHDFRRTVALSHAEQRERILSHTDLKHRIVLMTSEGPHVTMMFEVFSEVRDFRMSGIEVLKVEGGKIVENWSGLRDAGMLWSD